MEIINMVDGLGGCVDLYRNARAEEVDRIVVEVYSPPRIAAAACLLPGLDIVPGFSLGLTTGWDFNVEEHRRRAKQPVEEIRPQLLIGSPMCTVYSQWQHLNNSRRDPAVVAREKAQADVHLRFVIELYPMQVKAGRDFLHEHPAGASSWREDIMKKLMRMQGVDVTVGDQCQFGGDDSKGNPLKKPTKFLSNSMLILKELSRRCSGRGGACSRAVGGQHAVCGGMVARRAATYPFPLCRVTLSGFRRQLVVDGIIRQGSVGMHYISKDEVEDERAELQVRQILSIGSKCVKHYDDLTGQPFREDLVRHAISKEIDYFEQKGVWRLVPAEKAQHVTGKPTILVRWVHVNKGDDDSPNMRSRLVERQIRGAGQEAIFAQTPPLEGFI